jgi:hypothetical protein
MRRILKIVSEIQSDLILGIGVGYDMVGLGRGWEGRLGFMVECWSCYIGIIVVSAELSIAKLLNG